MHSLGIFRALLMNFLSMYRSESDHQHTAGAVRQRGRQHGWTHRFASAAEPDAVPGRSRHPCQSGIRDRNRPVAGLIVFLAIENFSYCLAG